MIRAACVQLSVGPDPAENLPRTEALIREAAGQGATLICTPEVTNAIWGRRAETLAAVVTEAEDPTLAALKGLSAELGIWLSLGSLALSGGADKAVNRQFLIDPEGRIRARYDKIHMFDVEIPDGQTYRESSTYRPGARAVLSDLPWGRMALTICYDLRFPHLYRALAKEGADLVTIPSAFTRLTGAAHWHVLLRARAIETGCFVLAAAQTGSHAHGRETYGHSLIVAPWGEVLADAGEEPGVVSADLDLAAVAEARRRVPSLSNDRPYEIVLEGD